MNADKQVSLHALCLLHANVQRHKKVRVTRQVSAHVGLRVDAVAQAQRNLQHHVFFTRAAGVYRAGVFAPVARVQRNNDQAVGFAFNLSCDGRATG